MHVLVAGCGWLGQAVAGACLSRGDRVTGVRRDPGRARALVSLGVTPLCLDLADPASAHRLPGDVEAVVACQSASSEGTDPYRAAYVDANRTLLEAARRMGMGGYVYTGSTGVFGQRDGEDVDEETAPEPSSTGAAALLEGERLVLEGAASGLRASVVRLSGLYGPGRAGVVDRVRSGALALGPGDETWMNFCHLDDAVAAVLAALDRGRAGAVYHATDACPARRREVVEWVAARLGLEPQRRGPAAEGAPGSRPAHRRVLGERTRAELGLALRWPSFRQGLLPLLPPLPGCPSP